MKLQTKEQFLKDIIINNISKDSNIVDATCGNGYDTEFLAKNFPNSLIYAVDIQKEAIDNTKKRCIEYQNIEYVNENHLKFFSSTKKEFDFVIFNTGYLPQSNNNIKTDPANTALTLYTTLDKLKIGGIIAITVYTGHDNGQEDKTVNRYLSSLNNSEYIVFKYVTVNTKNSPQLYIVEKKNDRHT